MQNDASLLVTAVFQNIALFSVVARLLQKRQQKLEIYI